MKRSPKSEFDDAGNKWFESPVHKETKLNQPHPGGLISHQHHQYPPQQKNETDMNSENGESTNGKEERENNMKILKERFYDFIKSLKKLTDMRIDYEYLNQNITIKIDKMPNLPTMCQTFEKICIKLLSNPRVKKNWSEDETILFIWIIVHYSHLRQKDFIALEDSDWICISNLMPGKKIDQCKCKWQCILKINLSKIPWTQKEDDLLMDIVNEKGPKQWKDIAKELNSRTGFKHFRHGKQCRERWINHLDPSINRGLWTALEDIQLLKLQLEIGKKWADLAKRLGSRTENSVKNRWNSLIKKYRVEFGLENDQRAAKVLLQKSPNFSIEEIERKICLMIIEAKELELNQDKPLIDLKNPDDSNSSSTAMITENDYYQKIPNSTTTNTSNSTNTNANSLIMMKNHTYNDTIYEKFEEETSEKSLDQCEKSLDECKKSLDDCKKHNKIKKISTNVDKSKNLLRELINQERELVINSTNHILEFQQHLNGSLTSSSLSAHKATYTPNLGHNSPMNYSIFSNTFNLNNSLFQANLSQNQSKISQGQNPNPMVDSLNHGLNQYLMGSNVANLNDTVNPNNSFFNPSLNKSLNPEPNNLQTQGANGPNEKLENGYGSTLSTSIPFLRPESTLIINSDNRVNDKINNMPYIDDQPQPNPEIPEIRTKLNDNNTNLIPRTELAMDNEEKNDYIKLKQVSYSEFKISDIALNDNQVYYAMVDIQNKKICFITSVTRDSLPWMLQNKLNNPSNNNNNFPNSNPNNFQSPIYSPPHPNLFNSPLVMFNNQQSLSSLSNISVPMKSISKDLIDNISKSRENSPNIINHSRNIKKEMITSNEWIQQIDSQRNIGSLCLRDQIPSSSNNNNNSYVDFLAPCDPNPYLNWPNNIPFFAPSIMQNLQTRDDLIRSYGLGVEKFKNRESQVLIERYKPHDSPSSFINTSNRNVS